MSLKGSKNILTDPMMFTVYLSLPDVELSVSSMKKIKAASCLAARRAL